MPSDRREIGNSTCGTAKAARKKGPQQDQQVHHQEDAVDPGHGGIGPLCTDVVEAVAVLALAELALNRNALQVLFTPLCLQSLELLTVVIGELFRPSLVGARGGTRTRMTEVEGF